MTDGPSRPASIAWDAYRRWFLRGRLFRLAVQVRTLVLGSAGVLSTLFGWWCVAQLFSGTDDRALQRLLSSYESCPWRAAPTSPGAGLPIPAFASAAGPNLGLPPADVVLDPWQRLTLPVVQFFDVSRSFVGAAFLSLCILWSAAVWALFGGALTRGAVLQLTREEPASPAACLRHAARRFAGYFGAPLLPLCVVVGVAVPLALVVGLPMRASVLVGGLLWPLVLLGGLIMTICTAALPIGWPLMHSTISAEGSDGFDAISRSYAYVYQRPLHYLAYAASAVVLGLLGLVVVKLFAAAVWNFAAWGVGWGSGVELLRQTLDKSPELHGVDAWGAKLVGFWRGTVDLVVLGFAFGYFWTAAAAIYLLLRHDADGVPVEEVFLDDAGPAFGLPGAAVEQSAAEAGDVAPQPADIASQPE